MMLIQRLVDDFTALANEARDEEQFDTAQFFDDCAGFANHGHQLSGTDLITYITARIEHYTTDHDEAVQQAYDLLTKYTIEQ